MDFKKFAKLIMIEQTLFALPFAYIGILFAGGGEVLTWVWVSLAVFAARTAGMCFNRLIDTDIDRKNPRTMHRLLPRGEISTRLVLVLSIFSSLVLIFSAYMLNDLCFYLSFVAIFLLFTYSYTKRFSSISHLYLGFVEAAAPIGGFLAVTGEFSIVPIILGIAIMFWITGLDIIYAIQDREFDISQNLHSIPARFGRSKAVILSTVSYFFSFSALVAAGIVTGRSIAYWVSVLCVVMIFFRQQKLARNDDIVPAINEFFQINRYISPLLFIGSFIDVFIN